MSLEVLYKYLYGSRKKVAGYLIVYVISLVMSFLSDSSVLDGSQTLWEKMTDFSNSAVVILALLLGLSILYYLALFIAKEYSRKQNLTAAFTGIMKAHTSEFAQTAIVGGMYWGENRTLWMAPNMLLGMDPKSVVVSNYDDDPYVFDENLKESFDAFEKTKYLKDIQKVGNDLPRYMLTRFGPNFNKEKPLLTLQLKKTFWRHCQFVWNRFVEEEDAEAKRILWHESIIGEHLKNNLRVVNYPNSLCLHLVIETSDGGVLITEISKQKKNDYPSTKAASLGEQIELSDFVDYHDFQQDVVSEWTKRAVCEEFGINAAQYEEEFIPTSLRVLSLDFEMDIYNFALVCTIKMRNSCEQFRNVVNSTIEQKEISDMFQIPLENIPGILMKYPDNNKEYHPSTYLRLLLFYLYKNGYRRTCERFCRLARS